MNTMKRYSGNVHDALRNVLIDDGARLAGSPRWKRDEDPELYDAIVLIRDLIVEASRESYPDESPFNIGSSYQRWINSWLSSTAGYELFCKGYSDNPEVITGLDILDKRVAQELAVSERRS